MLVLQAEGGPCAFPGRRSGFTLTELLVVVLIIGILSVWVVPRMEIVKFKMDGAARGYMAALVAAQRSAVKRQHTVVVAFDTVNQRIRIHEDADNDGVVDNEERVRDVPLREGVRFGLGAAPARSSLAASTVSFPDVQDGMPVVWFLRNGSASAQGSFYLTSERAVHGGNAKDTRAIEVARATGRTTWFYYDPPAWKQGF